MSLPTLSEWITKRQSFSKWCWLWLWAFRTSSINTICGRVFYKSVFGRIYITKVKRNSQMRTQSCETLFRTISNGGTRCER